MNAIEIFKAGTRTDGNGIEVTITPDDLDAIAANYDPAVHEAPLVVGHPQHDNPAYGWVESLVADGDTLRATPKQVEAVFSEAVKNGRYKKVSAAFYLPNSPRNPKPGAFYLRHVGFLGAMPPAVKGLSNPEFNDSEEDVVVLSVDFSEESTADAQAENITLQELSEKSGSIASTSPSGESMDHLKEIETLKSENARLQARIAADQKAKEEENNIQFAEGLLAEGKLLPANKEAALALLNTDMSSVEFGEDGFKAQFKEFLSTLPKSVEFSELATEEIAASVESDSVEYAEGTSPASIDVDQKVRAYMQQHNVTYSVAFDNLFK